MESLSYSYVYHRGELHILSITKTPNNSFPPKVFVGGTMGQNLKVGLTGGGGYENRRPPVAKISNTIRLDYLWYDVITNYC